MTIDELKQYTENEFRNIDRILDELFTVFRHEDGEYTLAEQAAISTYIMNAYSAVESILKQMLLYDKLDVGDAPGWHEKVLRKAGEIGILPPELLHTISKYLSFRNYFIYTYMFNIKWEDMKPLAEGIKDLIAQIRSETDEYLQTI
ncbi:MAG: hypothetical protein HZC49_02160 [Nitrospirae bacterium]|nr:hypothetical protein [Nitrospirota bacterium]